MALNKAVRNDRERRDLAFHQVVELNINMVEQRAFIMLGSWASKQDAVDNPTAPLDRQMVHVEGEAFVSFIDNGGNVMDNAYELVRTNKEDLADAVDDEDVRPPRPDRGQGAAQ